MKRLPILVMLSATILLTGCSGNDNGENRMKRPAPATAQEGLADMKALFRDIAALVGTIESEHIGESARFCDPPLDDLVFFDWGLDVDVTSAPTGAAALDAIEQELDTRGLTFRRVADDGAEVENVLANDGRMVMRVSGSKTTPEITITGSSACGPGEEYEQPAVP